MGRGGHGIADDEPPETVKSAATSTEPSGVSPEEHKQQSAGLETATHRRTSSSTSSASVKLGSGRLDPNLEYRARYLPSSQLSSASLAGGGRQLPRSVSRSNSNVSRVSTTSSRLSTEPVARQQLSGACLADQLTSIDRHQLEAVTTGGDQHPSRQSTPVSYHLKKMTALLDVGRVQYRCSCDSWQSLCYLYFCRHCTVLRCKDCIAHEIDSTFCPNCLENMPKNEAQLRKNRCSSCLQCPCCLGTLTTRATTVHHTADDGTDGGGANGGAASTPKKAYYMVCNGCRWSTRDAALPDQPSATGAWPKHTFPDETQLNKTLEHFCQLAAVEKAERERKKFTKRRSNMGMFYTDKYGLQAIYARRRMGVGLGEKTGDQNPLAEESSVIPTENVSELPDGIFTEELRLENVCTLAQRHGEPLAQPETTAGLYPLNMALMVRRSLRCKECDHNLCKSEYNPSSTKFKIQMFALLHVPDVRLVAAPTLSANKECEVHITLSNLSSALMHVVLLPDAEHIDDPKFAKVALPVAELVLAHRDETMELDDVSGTTAPVASPYKDDPQVVIFRKRHKLGIRMMMTPAADVEEDVWASFVLKYDYVNTYVSPEAKEPDILWLQQVVKLNLGKLAV